MMWIDKIDYDRMNMSMIIQTDIITIKQPILINLLQHNKLKLKGGFF